MTRYVWRWLAVSSIWLMAAASAETRPHYGGVLRVMTHTVLASLDPHDDSGLDSFHQCSVMMLMYDTLVTTDASGRIQPSLASSWQSQNGNRRWQFRLRHGIKFDDDTPLTAEGAAASLRFGNSDWSVSADGDSVVIEVKDGDPELPAELALPRNAIAKRNGDGRPYGTGPFRAMEWNPGKKLTFAANDNYWAGRPFLDGVEIEMGKSFRDQLTALDLGQADLVEIAPEQLHRASLEKHHVVSSRLVELVALLFAREATSVEEKNLRAALSLSIDRGSIRSVLLQGEGQATASILPNWLSGYGFAFPADFDLARARAELEQARSAMHAIPSRTIQYDASDPLARVLAERVTLNAKDAGFSLQPTVSASADLRIVRIPLVSADPWIDLTYTALLMGSPLPRTSGSVEEMYAAEQTLLQTQQLIPLLQLPVSYGSSGNLNGLEIRLDGTVSLASAWLEGRKP